MRVLKVVNTLIRPGVWLAAPTIDCATASSCARSPPWVSCTSILKPPVVPMPRTGGGDTLMTSASWIGGEFLVQRGDQRVGALALLGALLERIERREHDGGIRRGGEGGAVEPDDGHGMRDARRVRARSR